MIKFELSPPATAGGAWTETVLHTFTGGSENSAPVRSVCDGSHVTCHRGNEFGTTSAERMQLTRRRRRQGKHHIKLLVNEDEIDFLLARGYPLKRTDNRSIAEAVSAYLADSVLEGE